MVPQITTWDLLSSHFVSFDGVSVSLLRLTPRIDISMSTYMHLRSSRVFNVSLDYISAGLSVGLFF